jgi:hypothetical protein
MAINEYRFDMDQVLIPAMPSSLNRLAPMKLAASQSVVRGQSVSRQTSSGSIFPMNRAATDGRQTWCGFAQMSGTTDAAGLFYPVFGGTAGATNYLAVAQQASQMYVGGIFNPRDLITAALGSPVAEIDTVTIGGTVAVGDFYSVQSPVGGVEYNANVATGASVTTALCELWNADPALLAIAVASNASNVSTFTAVTAGSPLVLSVGKNSSAGTITLAIATPATVGSQVEVDTWTYSTNPSIGDTFTLTSTSGGLTTVAATFTATAATVANVTAGLAAAWNNSFGTFNVATATSTATTVVLTAKDAYTLSVVATTSSSTTTSSKAVTTPALGVSLADVLPGCPGARIVQPYGYWELP